MKPNLFIVGAAKAGTTSLYHYLNEHPDVYMSEIKETNFFSYDDIKAQDLFYNEEHINTLAEYESQFKNSGSAKIVGEASVSYLFYADVAQKLKSYNPDAKILIMLRNPVARAYSHYLMDKRLGFVNLSFEDILHKTKSHPKLHLYYQQYIELGFYHDQVKRYLSTFGNKAVRVFLYDDLIKNTVNMVKEVYSFLNVNENFNPQTETNHNAFAQPKNKLIEKLYALKPVRKLAKNFAGSNTEALKNLLMSKNKKPQLTAAVKNELLNIYKQDILLTQSLINKDVSSWLTI